MSDILDRLRAPWVMIIQAGPSLVYDIIAEIVALRRSVHALKDTYEAMKIRSEAAEAELARFKAERPYVIGCNDGFEAALEQAADLVELRATNYERIADDVWLTDTSKSLYSSMQPLFMKAASAIRALKADPVDNSGGKRG